MGSARGTGRRSALLVASTGGHLEEIRLLRGSLAALAPIADGDIAWVTFDSPQSRTLLAGEPDVTYLSRIGSRGYVALLRALVPAVRLLFRARPRVVVSTGAGIALAFLPLAPLVGARGVYVESAARTDGPSWTGRLLAATPWVGLRTQYRSWARGRWRFVGSVFDGWRVEPRPAAAPTGPAGPAVARVVVTLGTQEGFPFTALVRRLREIAPAGVDVRWQVGPDLPADDMPPGARSVLSSDEMREWLDWADVVVSHAGVGTALAALQAGRTPVLVPRRAERDEHIDDHQELIAIELAGRGLARTVDALTATWADITSAAAWQVSRDRADGPDLGAGVAPRPPAG